MGKIRASEITPEHLYYSRRQFIRKAGALAASALVLGGCGQEETPTASPGPTDTIAPSPGPTDVVAPSPVPTGPSPFPPLRLESCAKCEKRLLCRQGASWTRAVPRADIHSAAVAGATRPMP